MEMFRKGTFPSCSPQPLSAPFSLWLPVTGWGQSCPAGIVLGSSRLASGAVPSPEGPPGTAAQMGTRWSVTSSSRSGESLTRTRACPKSPEAGGPHPWKAQLLHPVFRALGAHETSWVLSQGHKVSAQQGVSGNSLDCR